MNKPKEFWIDPAAGIFSERKPNDPTGFIHVVEYDGENGYKWVLQQRDGLMIHYKEVLKKMLIANEALQSISHSGSRSKLADEAYEAWVQTCDAPRPFMEEES